MNKKEIKQFQGKLTTWYDAHQRSLPWRETSDPYHIWVSEVMLQQTQVDTVIPYFNRFVEQFQDIKHLADADLQDVLKMWEGLGYYARARNFHRAANVVQDTYHGIIPDDPETFQELPGVGDYIASAVQSIAFDHPCAVVDGNVKRVLARLFEVDTPVNNGTSYKTFKSIANELLDIQVPGIFNQAMMELGALVCKPKQPACNPCPVSEFCLARDHSAIDDFPKRIKKSKVPVHHIVAGVVIKNDRLLITQRKPEGLLGGMWEFPSGAINRGEKAESACIRNLEEKVNLAVKVDSKLARVTHAYTHFRIKMDVFLCHYKSGRIRLRGPAGFKWVTPGQIDLYPFHKANLKFIPDLIQKLDNET